MTSEIRRITGDRLYGPAFTVQTIVGDSSTLHHAVNAAPSGTILVIDAGRYTDRAVWGDVLSLAATTRGIRGAVIDGAIRDVEAIAATGFTVFARAVTPAGPHKGWLGDWGGMVSCGGVAVTSGDLVIGDGDGLVVVPHREVDAVRAAVLDRLLIEQDWRERIAAGESSLEVLGLTDLDQPEVRS